MKKRGRTFSYKMKDANMIWHWSQILQYLSLSPAAVKYHLLQAILFFVILNLQVWSAWKQPTPWPWAATLARRPPASWPALPPRANTWSPPSRSHSYTSSSTLSAFWSFTPSPSCVGQSSWPESLAISPLNIAGSRWSTWPWCSSFCLRSSSCCHWLGQ